MNKANDELKTEEQRQAKEGCHPEWRFSPTLRASLSSLQNFLAQEWEGTSAIHRALNGLQLVDFSFDRSGTVNTRDGILRKITIPKWDNTAASHAVLLSYLADTTVASRIVGITGNT